MIKLKQDKDLKLAIECSLDQNHKDLNTYRFTFGSTSEPFSGSVYIKKKEDLPKMLILMFNLKKDEQLDLSLSEVERRSA